MANKKISELESRASLSLSDLMAVGDPSTGYLYKTTISDLKTLTGAGVVSFNGRFGTVNPAEGDYNLTQLGDVIITSPSNTQLLQYNGSNWVNWTPNYVTAQSGTANYIAKWGASSVLADSVIYETGGNISIGSNNPFGYKLNVQGTMRIAAPNDGQILFGNQGNSYPGISLNGSLNTQDYNFTSNSSDKTLYINTPTGYGIRFLQNNESKMFLAATGNLLINTSTDAGHKLAINGGFKSSLSAGHFIELDHANYRYLVNISNTQTLQDSENISFTVNGTGIIAFQTALVNRFVVNNSGTITISSLAGTGSRMVVADANGVLSTQAIPSTSGFVTLDTTQTITGAKTFSTLITAQHIKANYYGFPDTNGYSTGFDSTSNNTIQVKIGSGLAINIASNYNTTFYGNIIRNGGTSSQFLKADGSLDSNTYLTSGSVAGVYLPLSGGTLTGALVGTSATFSGTVEAPLFFANSGGSLFLQSASDAITIRQNSTSNNLTIKFNRSGVNLWGIQTVPNGANEDFRIYNYQNSTSPLTLASTGAATFSSSVTTNGGNFTSNINGLNTYQLNLYNTFGSATQHTHFGAFAGNSYWSTNWYFNAGPAFDDNTKNSASIVLNGNGNIDFNNALPGNAPGNKMTILSNGNVGINTTNPTNLLHLAGASATPSLRLGSVSAGFHWDIGRENATTGDFVFNNANGGSASEKMRITVGGNVGINTSNPGSRLTIYEGDLRLFKTHLINNTPTWKSNILFTDEVDRIGAKIVGFREQWDGAPMGISFETGGVGTTTTRLTIASSGLATFTGDVKVKTLEVTNATTYGASSGISTYMQITVNGQNYVIPLHGTP